MFSNIMGIVSRYLSYFECSLQVAAALIEKTERKTRVGRSQTHLNPNHSDHRLAQKQAKNNIQYMHTDTDLAAVTDTHDSSVKNLQFCRFLCFGFTQGITCFLTD